MDVHRSSETEPEEEAGYETEPGSEITTTFESLTGSDRCHQAGRDNWPDPRNTHQSRAIGFAAAQFFDLVGDRLDALIQMSPVLIETSDRRDHLRRELFRSMFQYLEQ